MKTAPLRFLADMNLSPLTVAALRADGLDIVRVSSVLAVDASDLDILNLAEQRSPACGLRPSFQFPV